MNNHAESSSNEAKIQPYSIYIHVPFCKQACSYCDFYFVTRQQLIPDYVEALLQDISTSAPDFIEALSATGLSPRLESVYLGGGTPSRLPVADIERIMKAIERHHGTQYLKEVTIETNPDDVSNASYLHALKDAGITRLSMGIQSFDPDLLKFMNRAHSSEEARRSLELIQQTGFESYTVDLIYGNPGQSLRQLENDINTFLSFNPPHISAYALTIEPGTRLGKYAELGRLTESDDSDVAAHMKLVSEILGEHGLQRYEVSNFAREGHEAVHNSSYWEHV
ncbi:MAG: radical SAM family heme chaperone HemW, partial [Balneolales bacterium]|nr:radical SAM family heme chaperone HemW [Balneolales bacterium]